MCGITGMAGKGVEVARIDAMVASQSHRGPDFNNTFTDREAGIALGHNRLSIIDLSAAGRQPMQDRSGRYWLVFNGEIYNYLELRQALQSQYTFQTETDSEVLLASYLTWGTACLDKLIGMFAFAIWDNVARKLFAARDRFGVKPFNYHLDSEGNVIFASEIKVIHAAGLAREPHLETWATYLGHGYYDHQPQTFWDGVQTLSPGHYLVWQDQSLTVSRWYDLPERVGETTDERLGEAVFEEYQALLEETIRLRFRSDVPVGINLSGGLDSSLLLALIKNAGIDQSGVRAFTFTCGDPRYDEWPWVKDMLAHTNHPAEICQLDADAVPALSQSVHRHQDEPFGGLPTLAYAHLFERAKSQGVTVLLDGQGMDEQWAGYDYYRKLTGPGPAPIIQGSQQSPIRPNCLRPEFLAHAAAFQLPPHFKNPLRNRQYRDIRYTKIPRALRFNDRVSMRASRELREPFLDHRLVELALRQPDTRKIQGDIGKWFLRRIANRLIPFNLVEAPKRPLQTPQREWLRGPLAGWVEQCMDRALKVQPEWLDRDAMKREWQAFQAEECDNSFFIWQWIGIAEIFDPQEGHHD